MPAFPLPQPDMDALAAFVGGLRAPAFEHPPAGDAAAGESFFFGKGNCANCHLVKGRGGVLGPDLSNLGRETRLARIEMALRDPNALGMAGYKLVSVRLRSGRNHPRAGQERKQLRSPAAGPGWKIAFSVAGRDCRGNCRAEGIDACRSTPPAPSSAILLAFLSRLTKDNSAVFDRAREAAPLGGDPSFSAIANPKPGDWPTYHGRLSGNRHSELSEINTANVAQLGAKWMFPIADANHLEVTPVVVDGVMYVTMANQAYALDARSGRQIWHYSQPLTKGVIGDAGTAINRGVAVLGNTVFMVTDHAHIIALNRLSGELLWDTEMADYRKHYGATSAPLVVKDLVLSGTSGGDEGRARFRGRLQGFHRRTRLAILEYAGAGRAVVETWVGRVMESQHGCVDGWLTGTYDPSTDLIYWPTGNPCPDYNGDERKGDNLYSSSVLALEPETGKLRWHYQFSPHDLHDWDATETPMLIDAEFRGRQRKLLVQANRNGFFYVLDRVTGEFLLGRAFRQETHLGQRHRRGWPS